MWTTMPRRRTRRPGRWRSRVTRGALVRARRCESTMHAHKGRSRWEAPLIVFDRLVIQRPRVDTERLLEAATTAGARGHAGGGLGQDGGGHRAGIDDDGDEEVVLCADEGATGVDHHARRARTV